MCLGEPDVTRMESRSHLQRFMRNTTRREMTLKEQTSAIHLEERRRYEGRKQPKIEVEQRGCLCDGDQGERTHCEPSGSTQAERSRSIWRSTTVLGDEPQWSLAPPNAPSEPSSQGSVAPSAPSRSVCTHPSKPEIPRHFVAGRASKVSVRAGDVVLPRAGRSLSG